MRTNWDKHSRFTDRTHHSDTPCGLSPVDDSSGLAFLSTNFGLSQHPLEPPSVFCWRRIIRYLAVPCSLIKLSYKRGCQEKSFPPPLRGDMDVLLCIQPCLGPGRGFGVVVLGSPRIPARPTQLMIPTRRFHDAMVLDAFGSGSFASVALAKSANHDPI